MSFANYVNAEKIFNDARDNKDVMSKSDLIAAAKKIAACIRSNENHANEYVNRSGAFAASQLDMCDQFRDRMYAMYNNVDAMIAAK